MTPQSGGLVRRSSGMMEPSATTPINHSAQELFRNNPKDFSATTLPSSPPERHGWNGQPSGAYAGKGRCLAFAADLRRTTELIRRNARRGARGRPFRIRS